MGRIVKSCVLKQAAAAGARGSGVRKKRKSEYGTQARNRPPVTLPRPPPVPTPAPISASAVRFGRSAAIHGTV